MIDLAPFPLYRPVAIQPDDDQFVGIAAELGARFAPHAATHDRDNTFVDENFRVMRESGFLRLAVPVELGGMGATMRQVCYAQAELAKHCASTALAVNMHHYLVLSNVFRWKKGLPGAENTLRRVAADGIVLMTSGGSDGLWPSATAVRENGGYRVSGRKIFCSQAPAATVLATMAAYDDPDEGKVVLLMGIPMASAGVEILDTWDTLGMRATASQDVHLTDVAVAETQILARRPWGKMDPALRNAAVHFAPPVASVYFGVAAGARDEAVCTILKRKDADGKPLAQDALIQRQIGEMDVQLRVAWWGLMGALSELGDDYALTDAAVSAVMIAKRQVIVAAQAVVDLAMSVAGGSAYFKRSPLEQAYRDVRAGAFHPMNPEKTLLHTGRMALGESVETIW